MGGVIFQMYYGLIESQLFIILTKYISLERSESQDSIFCYRCNIEREIDRFVTAMHKKDNSMEFQWHPVAVFSITSKQNCI